MKLQPQVYEIKYAPDGAMGMHSKVLSAIRQRKKMSFDRMANRRAAWSKMEDEAQAYIKQTKSDSVREKARTAGEPQLTTIQIPYSYGMLLSWHTYMTSVFLSRSPIHQYEGRHGETADSCRGLEAVMDYNAQVGEHLVPYYIWLFDMGKYGLGVLGDYYCEEESYVTQVKEVPKTYFGIPLGGVEKRRQLLRVPGFNGIRVYNVRPQDWFPDPRVSIARFQEGEFCGRYVEVGWNTILKRAAQGRYFNVDHLRKTKFQRGKPGEYDSGSPRLELPNYMDLDYPLEGGENDEKREAKSMVGLLEMTIELIPADWGLGKSTYPEKWVFSVGNDAIVIGCEPLGEPHQKFPFDVMEYEVEGYALGKRAVLEVCQKLNETMTFLFDSHMHNVRRVINDQLVVDPSRLVMKDLLDPKAGRLVRVKPTAYGQDVKSALYQIPVTDITKTHLQDADLVANLMQRITGIVDPIQGMLNQGGRRTATEVRTSSTMGINRLKTNAEYASAMGWGPMSTKFVQMIQNHYTEEQTFRIAGDLTGKMRPVMVSPEMIGGFYNFVPVDGSMPVDRFAQAMLWKELFMLFKQIPQLQAGFDIFGIMDLIAWLSGVKNFNKYRIEALPNDQLANQVQAGNSVPLKGAPGGSTGDAGNTASGQMEPRGNVVQLPQSGAAPGVGRAG